MPEPRPIEILLVEDNPGDVILTKKALRKAKIANHLHVAGTGEDALEHLATPEASPDLILLDLNLPGISGHEVLEQLKQDPELRRIPVAVLTSSEAEEDILRSYEGHANCYITKPVGMDQFIKVVRSIEDFWMAVVRLPPRRTPG